MKATGRNPEVDRLRWQCRRGLLELDLLFEAFLEKDYELLTEADKALFKQLLEYPDQRLQEWLMDKERPEDGELCRLVAIIRKAV